MGFFDFKLIGIIFLIILFFILYYEVSYLRSKVNHLSKSYDKFEKIDSSFLTAKKTNKIISSEDSINFNDGYSDEKLNEHLGENLDEYLDRKLNETLNEKLDENFDEKLDENFNEKLDENFDENLDIFNEINHDFLNNCLIKTINIPIDINNILDNYNNVEIIEIFPTELVLDNSDCDLQFIQHDIDIDIDVIEKNNSHIEVYSNDQSDMDPIENINQPDENNSQEDNNNQIDKNINQSDKNISQSDKNIKQSETKQSETKQSENNLNNQVDNSYKNILKKILKYKLPELQDISIKYKLPLQLNNKKKTRLELIEDIKNYINKNI
jgi:hypothetical protein